LFFEPVLKERVWGGRRLLTEYPYRADGECIGECWAVSAHPNGECVIRDGIYEGKTLAALYEEHRELFGDISAEKFPLLVKLIDAREDLSIQVHPDTAYARVHENGSLGKSECWYVLDCAENASVILGHRAKSKEELKQMIAEGKYRELLREVPVKRGTFLQIPPGTVHAIKGGVLILEVQQSSDISYRIYDYDRLENGKKRPLHLKQSMDVIRVPDDLSASAVTDCGECPVNCPVVLADCEEYRVWKLAVRGNFSMNQEYPFLVVSVAEGSGTVDGYPVEKGTHLMLPAGYGTVEFSGEMELILSSVPEA